MKKIFVSVMFSVMLFSAVVMPIATYAQSSGDCKQLEAQIKALGGSGSKEAQELLKKFPRNCSPLGTASKLINLLLTFSGVAAVLVIIYGGFMMMTSAGNEETFGKGKKTLVYAVVGLGVILLAGVIVNVVVDTVKTTV